MVPPRAAVQALRGRWCAAAVIAAAAALVLLPNLGGPALWDEDEPLNAACSLAMLQTGDWVVPTFNGRLRIEKPALVNWLHLAGFAAAGPTETGARLPSALLSIGTSLLTWRLGCRMFGATAGLWSGLVMATCVWTGVAGRAATPDAPLGFFTTLALLLFAEGLFARGAAATRGTQATATRLPLPFACAVGAACGLATLTKGPVGLVLPAASFLLFSVWQAAAAPNAEGTGHIRHLRAALFDGWRRARPVAIAASALAVAAPWYAVVTLRTDGEWLRGFLLVHNASRFTGVMEGHSGSAFLYYPLVLLIGLFPWSCSWALVGLHAARTIRDPAGGAGSAAGMRLLAAWAIVWVGLFSLSATKLPGYVWPAYPALAVATGEFVAAWTRRPAAATDRWMRLAWLSLAGAGIVIAVGLPLAAARLDADPRWLGLIGIVPLAAAATCWLLHARCHRAAAAATWAMSGCLTVGLLAAVASARIGGRDGTRGLVARLAADAEAGRSSAVLAACGPPPSVAFYAGRLAAGSIPDLATADAVAAFAAAHPDGRLIVDASRLDGIQAGLPHGWRALDATTTAVRRQRLLVVGRGPAAAGQPQTVDPTDHGSAWDERLAVRRSNLSDPVALD